MHSSTTPSSSSTTTTNIEQYHYPPISTLRRPSRPSNINLSLFEHNNAQLSNDPGIYSAPIYVKQSNDHHHQQHIQHQHQQHQQQQPYTASFQYHPQQQQQHIQLPVQNHNIQICQQQQQQLMDPYAQHTPHTFPLQGSPNHYHQYFYFPPSTIPSGVTTNGHQTASAHNSRLRAVQIQEQQQQQQQQWSNPVLSPLLVKRMNENAASMSMDDDEDPSASIDALVADVDSSPLDDQQNKSMDESKTTSTTPAGTISPSPHIYLRGTSHILTTPPNPLASDDHPDNQLTVGNNFQKTFSPIPSAGFELTTKKSASTNGTSYFTFDATISEQTDYKTNEEDKSTKSQGKNLIQDDNSNQSSTNSSGHHTSSRIYSQMLQSSEQQRLSSSSPLSNDIKLSPLDSGHNQSNRHYCAHPDCNKIFANKSALAKHKLTHSQDRKHKCSKCNKGFKRLDHLHGHMLTHEEEKPHKCRVPNCNRTYCDARSLKRHIENVHQDILAAIYEGKHDEYRQYLPDTAVVKTKDLSITSEFSIDSVDSNSPRSLNDNEQSFNIRTGNGTKMMTTYTYDEEKCIECQICKKPFKNGAALNGHMRLHGGFNEKQPSSSSTDIAPKKKRAPVIKRQRVESPSTSVTIKTEKQDVSMVSSSNNNYHPSSFSTLSIGSNVLQSHFHDQTSSRIRSASSPFLPNSSPSFPHYTIKNPLSVQPSAKQSQMVQINPMTNAQILSTPHQQYDDKFRKSFPTENDRQMNGVPPPYAHVHTSPQQNLPPSHYQINPIPSNSQSSNLRQQVLRQIGDLYNQDLYAQHPLASSFEEPTRYTSSPNFIRSPITHSTSMANTPVASPYASHSSPVPTTQISNNHPIINNGIQQSPANQSTSSSCSSSSSLSSHTAPKKRILNAMKQMPQDEKQAPIVEERPPTPTVLEVVSDNDSPAKKHMSGFLIATPSSTGTNSSSSTSSHTHFNYEEVPPQKKQRDSTPSSFQWPSQFRRQLSLNIAHQTLNPAVPSTPYTPPPMLSPFRKGPGLYYRVFSQPGPSTDPSSIPTTPIADESTSPKINIGREYQAAIPKLRTDRNDYRDDVAADDELLFSPYEITSLDEKSLDKFEQLNRINPYLFSPRHSPTSYPLELSYMLLYEYNGDLQRTLAALLEGTAKDIKQCRPIHRYRFPECDKWTPEEIDAFTKAIQSSEKNFELVSRAVGTKTIKQCIEFHYMPKVNLTSRKVYPKPSSSVVTRRKRYQMVRTKQQLEDETSSSSFNDFRLDDDSSTRNSDSPSSAQFCCDIDECSQTFTTDRACRAHRKEHRRTVNNMTAIKTKTVY